VQCHNVATCLQAGAAANAERAAAEAAVMAGQVHVLQEALNVGLREAQENWMVFSDLPPKVDVGLIC
jgi:hypothetical protein